MIATTDTTDDISSPPRVKVRNTSKRIAIIGCGPKGMYCLESLLHSLGKQNCDQTNQNRLLEIVVFEPVKSCGAGNVYDPGQPHFLKMNFASGKIDAWAKDNNPDKSKLGLVGWLNKNCNSLADPQAYVPRAIVGSYLQCCFNQIVETAPANCSVDVRKTAVDDVLKSQLGWHVVSGNQTESFDEVLLTVGHGGWRSSNNIRCEATDRFVPNIFPTHKQLSLEQVPPQSSVVVGGFSLTFIDCVITLSEGRGGNFKTRDGQYVYVGTSNQPQLIAPFCRSGRPMLCKPMEDAIDLPRGLESIWQWAQEEIVAEFATGTKGQNGVWPKVWNTIVDAADRALELGAGRSRDLRNVAEPDAKAWFDRWMNQSTTADAVLKTMSTSYEIATGRRPLDESWAIAEAWRRSYKSLVDGISFGGLSADDWAAFQSVAREMERIAFGPPATNLRKIIALVESGLIDLRHLGSPKKCKNRIVIDATIAAPNSNEPSSLLGKMIARGTLDVDTVTGGVLVDATATAIDAEGGLQRGLAIIGRPTEGWVLGNDTLSRTLHSQPERWADRVLMEAEKATMAASQ